MKIPSCSVTWTWLTKSSSVGGRREHEVVAAPTGRASWTATSAAGSSASRPGPAGSGSPALVTLTPGVRILSGLEAHAAFAPAAARSADCTISSGVSPLARSNSPSASARL